MSSLLFTSIRIGNVVAKNRICISPMAQYASVDGMSNDWQLINLGARAIGGAGIVMMEATAVEPRGRCTKHDHGIWTDAHVEPLKRITAFIKSQNSIPAIQLAHSGRKGSSYPPYAHRAKHYPVDEPGRWETIAPSPIAFDPENGQIPKEATIEDIKVIRQAFVDAAKRSVAAGFEIIELHFAHGYLLHEFLSPYSNKRTDLYGGSFDNRIRLALEIVQDLKSVLPDDYPLFVRISCTEYLPEGEGWDLKQSIELAKRFKQLGVHLVDCSSGGLVYKIEYKNIDQIALADAIQREAQIATGAVGGIVSAEYAEQILQQNKATLVFVGRISLDNPNWPLHAAAKLNALQNSHIPDAWVWAIGEKTSGNWRQTALVEQNSKQLENGF